MVHIDFLNHFHIDSSLLIDLRFINSLSIVLNHKIQSNNIYINNSTSFNNNYNSIYRAADVFYPKRS